MNTPSRNQKSRSLSPGGSTAVGMNVSYRLTKLRSLIPVEGVWLDCGCAEGGYTQTIQTLGAAAILGIDLDETRVRSAGRKTRAGEVDFCCSSSEHLPVQDSCFDGVFMNEVLEHVLDERETLNEVFRVLRPGGYLALISPNRFFPFEGHGMRIGRLMIGKPVPLLPWLPCLLTKHMVHARNYWPWELHKLVMTAGFHLEFIGTVFPVFEVYRWLPSFIIKQYQSIIPVLERIPLIRQFGVSTFVLARKLAIR